MNRSHSLAAALLVSGLFLACGVSSSDTSLIESQDTTQAERELSVSFEIEAGEGSMILGSSSDGRRVVYGAHCDGDPANSTIALYDQLTLVTTPLAKGIGCQPGAYFFSPNGALVAFGNGQGVIRVHNASTGTTKVVSRQGTSGVGVAFSPDSSWFVVAQSEEGAMSATLDAWPASLSARQNIAKNAFFNPFGMGPDNVRFSADSTRLLLMAQLGTAAFPPTGALTVWTRSTRKSDVLAVNVAVGSYVIADDWSRVAYVRDAVMSTTPGVFSGTLEVRALSSQHVEVVEASAAAQPITFLSNGGLLYQVADAPGSSTLKRFAAGASTTIDVGVFNGPSAGSIVISPDRRSIAFTTGFDAMTFTAKLKVASLVSVAAPVVVAADAVPMTLAWVAGGTSLVYLRTPTAAGFGAPVGTLAAYSMSTRRNREVSDAVTQLSLRASANDDEVLFVSSYDAGQAKGAYRSWNAVNGDRKLLGQSVAVMSIHVSPDGSRAAFLTLGGGTATAPAATSLRIATIRGTGATQLIAKDVTSLALGNNGRLAYTTASGTFGAWAF